MAKTPSITVPLEITAPDAVAASVAAGAMGPSDTVNRPATVRTTATDRRALLATDGKLRVGTRTPLSGRSGPGDPGDAQVPSGRRGALCTVLYGRVWSRDQSGARTHHIVRGRQVPQRSCRLNQDAAGWSGRRGSNPRHPAWKAALCQLSYSRPEREKNLPRVTVGPDDRRLRSPCAAGRRPLPVGPRWRPRGRRCATISRRCITGSIALVDFQPATSDVDLLVATRSTLSHGRLAELADGVAAVSIPVRGLEYVVYPLAALRDPAPTPAWELNPMSDRGSPLATRASTRSAEPRYWSVLDLALARQSGLPLVGPAPSALIASIPRQWLRSALQEGLAWHDAEDRGSPNQVLNACRAWLWAEHGRLTSKTLAAEWAFARTGEAVIREALQARATGAGSN